MRNVFLILLTFTIAAGYAQDEKYFKAMEKNVVMMDTAKDVTTWQNVNNAFERISNNNPGEWLPFYYQSYCHIMIGMVQEEKTRMDEYYDRAEKLINKADSISPGNSEIYVVKSLVNSMKISVDPMNRGQKLGMQTSAFNAKAIELDKDNPRAYMMKGTGLMYTPAQYGGGKDKALPVLEQAVEKFKSFKPKNSIMPHWGEEHAINTLAKCKSAE
jgi:hypothetical protein